MPEGELAIVLHTHMPYVEGFGTWPFGEEWLWEAVATSYLPLLEVLDRPGGERLTLSLTPVLCDQLEAPGAIERSIAFLRELRPAALALDIEDRDAALDPAVIAELERAAGGYKRAADTLERIHGAPGGLLGALASYASWTSAATHPILPMLCLDETVQLQLRTGIESHRRRFGGWSGGLWSPECAYAPWLAGQFQAAGVSCTCVELTGLFGRGEARNLRPLRTVEGPILIPIDRATIDLVWGAGGYPAGPAYRARHRLTRHGHPAWSGDGRPYDPDRAGAAAVRDAAAFVASVERRLAAGGLCVFAIDTELFGHWWHEGPRWLAAVVAEADRRGLALTRLDDAALERHPPARAPAELPVSSWGEGGDLRTWSGPAAADLATRARSAELRTFSRENPPGPRALRELMALQSSDWAFLEHNRWAGDYPRERAAGHAAALERALAGELEPRLRNLAPYL